MHEYDAALKLLLQASSGSVLRQAIGHVEVTHWLEHYRTERTGAMRLLDASRLEELFGN